MAVDGPDPWRVNDRQDPPLQEIVIWAPVLLKRIGSAGLFLFAASLPLSIAGANIGWTICLAALLADAQTRKTFWNDWMADPLFRPWVVFLAAAMLASLFGIDPKNSLPMLRTDMGKALVYFVIVSSVLAFNAKAALWGYLLAALVAAGWGIYQPIWTRFPFAHGSVHHVTYGELIALALTFCLARLAFVQTKLEKTGMSACLAILSAALALSHARAAWLAAVAALILCVVLYAPGRKRLLIVAAAYLALAIAVLAAGRRAPLMASLAERASTIFSTSFRSNEIRLISWKVGFEIFKDHPLFGVGPRNVRQVFNQYYGELIEGERDWSNLHNLFIHQLAERGLIGLSALLYLFASFWGLAWRWFKENPSALSLWALAGLSAFFLMNLTETSFQHEIDAYMAVFMLAVARLRI